VYEQAEVPRGRRFVSGALLREAVEVAERRLVLQAQSQAATDEVVEMYTPLIESMAQRYHQCTALQRDELQRAGVAALLRAMMRYEAEFDAPFWSYASWSVRRAMQQVVTELTRPVVLSDRAARPLTDLRWADDEDKRLHSREATIRELMTAVELAGMHFESLVAADGARHTLDRSSVMSDERRA
jgi:RNA polymerase primary sigma factor